jgi:hypothetical protein
LNNFLLTFNDLTVFIPKTDTAAGEKQRKSLSGLGCRRRNPAPERSVFANSSTTDPKPDRLCAIVELNALKSFSKNPETAQNFPGSLGIFRGKAQPATAVNVFTQRQRRTAASMGVF